MIPARRTTAPAARESEITPSIVPDLVSARLPADRRRDSRRRTRLRSGKILDDGGQFLVECLIVDRSLVGGKLRLPGAARPLPPRLMLYDDQSGELLQVAVMWRRDREVGIRFTVVEKSDRSRAIADAMRHKFYAMRR